MSSRERDLYWMVAEEKDAIFVAPIIAMADRYTVRVTHELVHPRIGPQATMLPRTMKRSIRRLILRLPAAFHYCTGFRGEPCETVSTLLFIVVKIGRTRLTENVSMLIVAPPFFVYKR